MKTGICAVCRASSRVRSHGDELVKLVAADRAAHGWHGIG
jgi:hypothetical protein